MKGTGFTDYEVLKKKGPFPIQRADSKQGKSNSFHNPRQEKMRGYRIQRRYWERSGPLCCMFGEKKGGRREAPRFLLTPSKLMGTEKKRTDAGGDSLPLTVSRGGKKGETQPGGAY